MVSRCELDCRRAPIQTVQSFSPPLLPFCPLYFANGRVDYWPIACGVHTHTHPRDDHGNDFRTPESLPCALTPGRQSVRSPRPTSSARQMNPQDFAASRLLRMLYQTQPKYRVSPNHSALAHHHNTQKGRGRAIKYAVVLCQIRQPRDLFVGGVASVLRHVHVHVRGSEA